VDNPVIKHSCDWTTVWTDL